MNWPFQPGRPYSRRNDIHAIYGGQQQGGISTPVGAPAIFVFTGESGTQHGYTDAFQPDGTFRYTGEGQLGDMAFRAGNLAIRDHAKNGKDLLVFRAGGKGKPVTFIDTFSLVGHEFEQQPDRAGQLRQAIVFTLAPLDAINTTLDYSAAAAPAAKSLTDLRKLALAAASAVPAASAQTATSTVFARSAAVRAYVLARAAGQCEGCSGPAPFITTAGEPFLEAHHIRRLTDGGPDDPRHMAGICPNCHRRAHHGVDRAAFNAALQTSVSAKEKSLAALPPST